MKKASSKKGSSTIDSKYVRLASLGDLARSATNMSDEIRPIFAIREKGSYRLFVPGIKIDETRMVFYTESREIKDFLVYDPGSPYESEKCELRDTFATSIHEMKLIKIPIVELANNPYVEKKADIATINLKVKEPGNIVKGVIAKSAGSGFGKVYCFGKDGKRYIGSFALIEEDDRKVFCYAQLGVENVFSFFRYNYNEDKVDMVNSVGAQSFLYARIVNLTEPFPFFKPD